MKSKNNNCLPQPAPEGPRELPLSEARKAGKPAGVRPWVSNSALVYLQTCFSFPPQFILQLCPPPTPGEPRTSITPLTGQAAETQIKRETVHSMTTWHQGASRSPHSWKAWQRDPDVLPGECLSHRCKAGRPTALLRDSAASQRRENQKGIAEIS